MKLSDVLARAKGLLGQSAPDLTMAQRAGRHRSRYGGLWIDLPEAPELAMQMQRAGLITKPELQQVLFFINNGYLVLPGAIEPDLVDRFNAEIARLWQTGHAELLVSIPPADTKAPLDRHYAALPGIRMLDVYCHVELGRSILLHSTITRFLQVIFQRPALLFQSLSFPIGSEQGMHQDTAYVVTDSPLQLAAAWIALEDVSEGCGELQYHVGSHRIDDFHFSGSRKHFHPGIDPPEEHDRYVAHLAEQVHTRQCSLERFLPQKGDALIWHADLVHGGSPITRPGATRKSLVGHYCPADVRPNFFDYMPDHATVRNHAGAHYCSAKYRI